MQRNYEVVVNKMLTAIVTIQAESDADAWAKVLNLEASGDLDEMAQEAGWDDRGVEVTRVGPAHA